MASLKRTWDSETRFSFPFKPGGRSCCCGGPLTYTGEQYAAHISYSPRGGKPWTVYWWRRRSLRRACWKQCVPGTGPGLQCSRWRCRFPLGWRASTVKSSAASLNWSLTASKESPEQAVEPSFRCPRRHNQPYGCIPVVSTGLRIHCPSFRLKTVQFDATNAEYFGGKCLCDHGERTAFLRGWQGESIVQNTCLKANE